MLIIFLSQGKFMNKIIGNVRVASKSHCNLAAEIWTPLRKGTPGIYSQHIYLIYYIKDV